MAPPSPSKLKKLTTMDPEISTWLSNHPMPKTQFDFSNPVQAMQKMRSNFNAMFPIPPPNPGVHESKSTYTTRDGTSLRLAVYTPSSPSSTPRPLCVWYHGGGFCLGFPEQNTSLYRSYVQRHSCIVIAPEYRLGPEHKYPTAVNDSWDALQYIASHPADFGADPTKGFVVGGESAGSILSAVLALYAKDSDLSPPLTGVFLSAGSYIPPQAVPEQYKDSYVSRLDPVCINTPGLDEVSKKAFDVCYNPDYADPSYRAILWKSGHAGLPRTYFQACGLDINRDDSFIYEDVLRKSGVQTRLDVYPGTPHCFWAWIQDIDVYGKWHEDSMRGLGWLFGES